MRRTLAIILVLCTLLTGCGSSDKESTLLKNRESFDDSGALWYIPSEQIEAQDHPALYSFADELLTVSSKYISDDKGELKFTILSSSTGELIQSCTVQTRGNAETQILGKNIAVSDSSAGTVIVLDEKLHEVAHYMLKPDNAQWFLGFDLDTLYKFSYDSGLSSFSISSENENTVLNMAELSICSITDTDICFTGVDLQTQRYRALCLDLTSGKMIEPPFSGDFSRICRNGELWLADFFGSEGIVAFGTSSKALSVTTQNGTFSLIDPARHILLTDNDGKLYLYNSDGAFVSSCDPSSWYVQNLIWREELGGYLLLVSNDKDENKLLFWDVSAQTDGEALKLQPLSTQSAVPTGKTADSSLYKRAKAISDRFGVEVLIADQCGTEFTNFTCYQLSDYDIVSAGLDTLESALSVFPDNFFSQLVYGHINRTQFQLIGGLTAEKDFGGDTSYAAFTNADGDVCQIVLDAYTINKNSVWHELSHAIDKRLAWDSAYRKSAKFSEDGWMANNPSGFAYSENYASQRNDIQSNWYSYFIDDYAMISSTEDRARIFENAIENSGTIFTDDGLKEKLKYYCECIRDCFDTTGWPKSTAWEAPLR